MARGGTAPAQGAGASSPYVGTVQTSDGVITLKLASGFFMQDKNGDGDPTTPDGIFVYGGVTSAIAGDLVRVKGAVAEFKPGAVKKAGWDFFVYGEQLGAVLAHKVDFCTQLRPWLQPLVEKRALVIYDEQAP